MNADRLNVLIDLFFKDLPMEQRIARIAACGYRAVETWQGGDAPLLVKIGEACRAAGVTLVSVVLNGPSDMTVAPVLRSNRQAFLDRVDRFSDNALAAGGRAGIVCSGNLVEDCTRAEQHDSIIEALRVAGEMVAAKGFALNVEPLNTPVDHKGYFLDSRDEALAIVKAVNLPNVRMLYDIYHMQIMHGNQLDFILPNVANIGHFHTAGVPGRHELFNGESNYPFILGKIIQAGYRGHFGLEYMPELESAQSLTRTREHIG